MKNDADKALISCEISPEEKEKFRVWLRSVGYRSESDAIRSYVRSAIGWNPARDLMSK